MRVGYSDFDVAGVGEQALVQLARAVVLAFFFFKVDVDFSQKLRHIKYELINCQFEYGSRAI